MRFAIPTTTGSRATVTGILASAVCTLGNGKAVFDALLFNTRSADVLSFETFARHSVVYLIMEKLIANNTVSAMVCTDP